MSSFLQCGPCTTAKLQGTPSHIFPFNTEVLTGPLTGTAAVLVFSCTIREENWNIQ